MSEVTQSKPAMRIYDDWNRRLYLNPADRVAFLAVLPTVPPLVASFAATIFFTGCRLSEARYLRGFNVGISDNIIVVRSLKKRNQHHIREIPVPPDLIDFVARQPECGGDGFLWGTGGEPIDRATGYRWIKGVMERAGIYGPQACPKGLRHGFGVNAVRTGVQLNMLQRWMGHASMETTAIYATALGEDERVIAERMWRKETPLPQTKGAVT